MKWHSIYGAWRGYAANHSFHRFKCAAAIDVLALVITFFGFFRYVSAAFSVRCGLA
jgi:uncharacterized membrane protein YkvI